MPYLVDYWWAYIACAVVIVYFVIRLALQGKKLEIKGKIPYKWLGSSIVMIICAAVIFINVGFSLSSVLLVLLIIGTTVLTCLVPSGLGTDGAYVGGRTVKYEKMYYYAFESNVEEGSFRMRINTGYRDLSLVFSEEQKEYIRAFIGTKDVMTFAEYKSKTAGKRRKK